MTNDDQYVPSEDDVRIAYVDEWVAQSDFLTRHQEREAERAGEAAWGRFLAHVRRDAAREALDGLARESMCAFKSPLAPPDPRSWAEMTGAVEWYRDTHYPKETP